jgi:hypothetical protein
LGTIFNLKKKAILDLTENFLPLFNPEILRFYANTRRCFKSHVAPFNLLLKVSALTGNGATKSLAL